jgi:hypothetical protein
MGKGEKNSVVNMYRRKVYILYRRKGGQEEKEINDLCFE